MSELTDAVEANDPDRLLRIVDGLCASRQWEQLMVLRDLCFRATERGKQLWGVAHHIEYRIALEAPPDWAGPIVTPENGAFALGPLPEVAASTHRWSDLADHLPPGPLRTVTAMECVGRGEDLTTDASLQQAAVELPLAVQPWEPRYPVAAYKSDSAAFPAPEASTKLLTLEEAQTEPVPDAEAEDALLALVGHWVSSSEGVSSVVSVDGTAEEAIATIEPHARIAEIETSTALAWMAWAAASGGAHGARRGSAAGRFDAWWVLATLLDMTESWPPDFDDLGAAAADLRWLWFVPDEVEPGWHLHLAAEIDGAAWAIAAVDRVQDDSDAAGPEDRQG